MLIHGIVPRTQSHTINNFWVNPVFNPQLSFLIHSYIYCFPLRGTSLLICYVHFTVYVSFDFSAMCVPLCIHSPIHISMSNLFPVCILLLGTPLSWVCTREALPSFPPTFLTNVPTQFSIWNFFFCLPSYMVCESQSTQYSSIHILFTLSKQSAMKLKDASILEEKLWPT